MKYSFIFIFTLSISFSVNSQTRMFINKTNGTSDSLNLSEIKSITFKTYSTSIPTNGLIAYYPFNGTTNDSSGNGNNGISFGATTTFDRFGNSNKACLITGNTGTDGSGIRVEIPDVVKGLSSVSISIWVKEDTLSYWHGESYLSFGSGTANSLGWLNIWHVGNSTTVDSLSFELSDSTRLYRVTFPFNASFRHLYKHYVITLDGSSGIFKAYIDGNLIGTLQTARKNIYTNASYGGFGIHWWDIGHSSTRFNGAIDDVRIYNRALSEIETQALYHEGGR
jgi:hypothetical protein